MTPRTAGGLLKCKPVPDHGVFALVAPASPFKREDLDAGERELRRLGYGVVYDDAVFAREPIVAGPAVLRATDLHRAIERDDVSAVMSVRGGYGSMEVLPHLDRAAFADRRVPIIGYSDITSLHTFLNCHVGMTSVHGVMVQRYLAGGPGGYDEATMRASLGPEPMGEVAPPGLESLRGGEAAGPLFGGCLSVIVASLGTPFAFEPPAGHVLFVEDADERPYKIRRMLVQLMQAGVLARASAIVFGQMLRCDEPKKELPIRAVIADLLRDFPGPILFGLRSGHTDGVIVSMPLGVQARVVSGATPALIFEEAAAG